MTEDKEPKKQINRNIYRVRITLLEKELSNVYQHYLGSSYARASHMFPGRESLLNGLGLEVTRNHNGVMKIGFPSKYDYLLFKLKWS